MSVYKNIKGKKGLLVWGIILFVVFMGLGLLIYSGEVDAKYEVLTKDTSENTYAKLNVSLLDSAFATETLDGKEKDYYVAFDEDDNPFIIVLDKDGLENLRKIQEYTLSEIEMDKPNPVTVYGNVSKSDTEVFKYLQEFLKDEDGNTYTIDELKKLGITIITPSVEANSELLQELINNSTLPTQLIAYGAMVLMNSSYCLLGKTNNCYPECKMGCKSSNTYYLKDRLGFKFRIMPDNIQTVTSIYNSKITSIDTTPFNVDSVRIDILDENIDEINNIVQVVKSGKKLSGNQYANGNLHKNI